jgi:hypothetical protein
MSDTKLFILAAMVTKQDGLRTVMSSMQGYRVRATEDEAKGSFVDAVMKEKPDFSITQILCMEVPGDLILELAQNAPTEAA